VHSLAVPRKRRTEAKRSLCEARTAASGQVKLNSLHDSIERLAVCGQLDHVDWTSPEAVSASGRIILKVGDSDTR
jgi:hypothetical protein